MHKIYKYPCPDRGTAFIPGCIRVLSVQLQHETPTIWAEVDPTALNEVEVAAIPTGGTVPGSGEWRYVATVVGINGFLVFHFYANGEKP